MSAAKKVTSEFKTLKRIATSLTFFLKKVLISSSEK